MIFFCYAREDKDRIQAIIAALATRGVRVWWDEGDIPPGDLWADEIRAAIAAADHFIPCISATFLTKSESFIQQELDAAREIGRNRPTAMRWIVPLLLDGGRPPALKVGRHTLSDVHAISVQSSPDAYADVLVKIIEADKVRQGVRNDPAAELRFAAGMIREHTFRCDNQTEGWSCDIRFRGRDLEFEFYAFTEGFLWLWHRGRQLFRRHGEVIFTKHEHYIIWSDDPERIPCEVSLENESLFASIGATFYVPFLKREAFAYGYLNHDGQV